MHERSIEVKKLRLLSKRLRKAASLVDLAATYWDDGAYGTARLRLRWALGIVENAVKYLAAQKWARWPV